MVHPAAQTVEEYYIDKLDAVTALFQSVGDKFTHEGAVRLSWDRGSFTLIQVHDDLAVVKTVVMREAIDRTPVKPTAASALRLLAGFSSLRSSVVAQRER